MSAPSPPPPSQQRGSDGNTDVNNNEVASLRTQVGSLTTLCADLELEVMLLRRALYQNNPSQGITSAAVDPLYIRAHRYDTHEPSSSSNQRRIGGGASQSSLNAGAMRTHNNTSVVAENGSKPPAANGEDNPTKRKEGDGNGVVVDALQARIKSLEALNMKLFMRTMDDTSELRYHRFSELQRGSNHHTPGTSSSYHPHHAGPKNTQSSSSVSLSKTTTSNKGGVGIISPHEVKQRFMEGKSAYYGRQLEVLQSTMLDGSRRDVGQYPIEKMAISRTRADTSHNNNEGGGYDDYSTTDVATSLPSTVDAFLLRNRSDGAPGGTTTVTTTMTHPSKTKSTFFEEVAHRNATGSSLGLARGLLGGGDSEPAPRTRLRDGTTATSVPYALRGYVGRY